jgi:subtilisin family serine protease
VDQDDYRASWSNYGTCVDLFAPGVNISSASHLAALTYTKMSGTSMATAHVAGAAAFILQAHPGYTPEQVHSVLVNGASGDVIRNPGPGSPNRMLYVRNVEPPAIGSQPVGFHNPRFGTTEVYARTVDNRIAYSHWAGGWSEWVDLGGNVVGNPAVFHNTRFGTTEVYARTADNKIQYRYYANGWSGWTNLEGNAAGDPSLLFNPRFSTTEVYTRLQNNHSAYRYYANGWSGWIDISL